MYIFIYMRVYCLLRPPVSQQKLEMFTSHWGKAQLTNDWKWMGSIRLSDVIGYPWDIGE